MTTTDLFGEIARTLDPHALVHRLREEDPVHFVEMHGFWFVTKYEHVMRLLHDPDNVTADARVWDSYVPAPEGTFTRWMEENGLFTLDQAQHGRLRKLASSAFGARAIQRMNAQIEGIVSELAAPIARHPTEVVDLFASFLNIVPTAVISRITGIRSGDDQLHFSKMVQAVLEGAIPFASSADCERAEANFAELAAWIRSALAVRRTEPGNDLLTDLASASVAGSKLTEDDIVLLLCSIIIAGVVTVANSASAVFKAVFEHPHVMDALRGDGQLAYRSIDELLRYSAGPAGPVRYASRSFSLGGRHISKGQMLMVSFAGACRDPSAYEEPDTLRLERKMTNLAVFGRGPHYCLGAPLARYEVASMLANAVLVLPAGSRIRADHLVVEQKGIFQGTANLPVELGRAKG
jgi:cytochrome P450